MKYVDLELLEIVVSPKTVQFCFLLGCAVLTIKILVKVIKMQVTHVNVTDNLFSYRRNRYCDIFADAIFD